MKTAKSTLLAKQLYFVASLILVCITLIVILIISSIKTHNLKRQYNSVSANVITKTETIVEEKEVVVEVEKTPNYTYDELYCMATVIYNEAGGNECTDEHRELVGYVVLNRVNSSYYPNTIREVLEQPSQYQGFSRNGVNFAKRSSDTIEAKALERAWITAKKVLENRDNIPIPESVVFQAEFKQGSKVYKQIGNTYFCYK